MTTPTIGILEWFRPGEHERVEQALADLRALGVRHLRTGVSWADWNSPEGAEWYDWLIPRLAREVDLVPCFLYTPPSLGIEPRTAAPPRVPKAYADFLDVMISRHGDHFEYVELWNEPNNISEWDWTLDPEWNVFCEMVGGAAYWAKQRGKQTILGGMSPFDPHWLNLMFERGVMQYIDIVGLHGFPGTWEVGWKGWQANLERVQAILDAHGSNARLWITETGFSTWQHDERQQLANFIDILQQPLERIYWYALTDLAEEIPALVGFHLDEREYHFGLRTASGYPKLLYRVWAEGGLDGVRAARWFTESPTFGPREEPVLITGGAGFVGTNLAHRLLSMGEPVLLLDNLSRPGVIRNLQWLREVHGEAARIEVADLRNKFAVKRAVERASAVYHFAAQVAVTTSLADPLLDFGVNAEGTLNLLEAVRGLRNPPPVIYTSTNKVYGSLDDVLLREEATRWVPEDVTVAAQGISESRPLDFHSPYGCSKGAADQYIIDYARTFNLPATVFRMSCIYGPHQHGTEDQGWVAHFLIQAQRRNPITLYGDGKQVRDVLFVGDLVDALLLARDNIGVLSGKAFNIGGGPRNTLSLVELLERIRYLGHSAPEVTLEQWRPGDQRFYVSDTTRFQKATGWAPRVGVDEGIARLDAWLKESAARRTSDAPQAAANV